MKWKKVFKNRAKREIYSNDKSVRGWIKNKEALDKACEEKKGGKDGYVYVFSLGDGLYKIGCTHDIRRRTKEFRASNPKVNCVWSSWCTDMLALEKSIHEIMKSNRIEREIFHLNFEQIMKINSIAEKFREIYG